MRRAVIVRQTAETQITLGLNVDGKGTYRVRTGIRFLDHMLELFAKHGGFDLTVDAKGDLDVDQHHTVEDIGIALGQLFSKALGDRKGINRAGYFVLPMDETLAVVAVDLGGRPALVYQDRVRVRLVEGPVSTLLSVAATDSFRMWNSCACVAASFIFRSGKYCLTLNASRSLRMSSRRNGFLAGLSRSFSSTWTSVSSSTALRAS